MSRVAARYRANDAPRELPVAADVRLGLAIASGDGLPLVVVASPKPAELKAKLAELAWSEEFIGRFAYAVAPSPKGCPGIDGAAEGVLLVEPDTFGRKGKVVRRVESAAGLAEAMRVTLRTGARSLSNRRPEAARCSSSACRSLRRRRHRHLVRLHRNARPHAL